MAYRKPQQRGTELSVRRYVPEYRCGFTRFVLFDDHLLCPGGHIGRVASEIWFDTTDQEAVEMLFDYVRNRGFEVEGVFVPRF